MTVLRAETDYLIFLIFLKEIQKEIKKLIKEVKFLLLKSEEKRMKKLF